MKGKGLYLAGDFEGREVDLFSGRCCAHHAGEGEATCEERERAGEHGIWGGLFIGWFIYVAWVVGWVA